MAQSDRANQVVRFDDYEIDRRACELTGVRDEAVRLIDDLPVAFDLADPPSGLRLGAEQGD